MEHPAASWAVYACPQVLFRHPWLLRLRLWESAQLLTTVPDWEILASLRRLDPRLEALRQLTASVLERYLDPQGVQLRNVIAGTAEYDFDLNLDGHLHQGELQCIPESAPQLAVRLQAIEDAVARVPAGTRVVLITDSLGLTNALLGSFGDAHTVVHCQGMLKTKLLTRLRALLGDAAAIMRTSMRRPVASAFPPGHAAAPAADVAVAFDTCVFPGPAYMAQLGGGPALTLPVLPAVALELEKSPLPGALAALHGAAARGNPVISLVPSTAPGGMGDKHVLADHRRWIEAHDGPTFFVTADSLLALRVMLLHHLHGDGRNGVLWVRQTRNHNALPRWQHVPNEDSGAELRRAVLLLAEQMQ